MFEISQICRPFATTLTWFCTFLDNGQENNNICKLVRILSIVGVWEGIVMTRSSRLAAYFLNSNRPEGQSTWQWAKYWKRKGGLCHRAVSWGNLTAGCSLWPLECFLPSGCMVMVQEWSCQRRQITCAPPSTPSNNVRPPNYTGWPADKGQGKWLGHQIKPY